MNFSISSGAKRNPKHTATTCRTVPNPRPRNTVNRWLFVCPLLRSHSPHLNCPPSTVAWCFLVMDKHRKVTSKPKRTQETHLRTLNGTSSLPVRVCSNTPWNSSQFLSITNFQIICITERNFLRVRISRFSLAEGGKCWITSSPVPSTSVQSAESEATTWDWRRKLCPKVEERNTVLPFFHFRNTRQVRILYKISVGKPEGSHEIPTAGGRY
jgi:hypothetical protein